MCWRFVTTGVSLVLPPGKKRKVKGSVCVLSVRYCLLYGIPRTRLNAVQGSNSKGNLAESTSSLRVEGSSTSITPPQTASNLLKCMFCTSSDIAHIPMEITCKDGFVFPLDRARLVRIPFAGKHSHAKRLHALQLPAFIFRVSGTVIFFPEQNCTFAAGRFYCPFH